MIFCQSLSGKTGCCLPGVHSPPSHAWFYHSQYLYDFSRVNGFNKVMVDSEIFSPSDVVDTVQPGLSYQERFCWSR